MAFNPEKFSTLPYIQKRKKLCYYIHRSLQENTIKYLSDINAMVDFINQNEYRQIVFDSSPQGLKDFYQHLQQEILENDPFQENILFDKPQMARTLLPNKIGIILENIRSPFNVGAFFRMAEAFGIYEVILIGVTPSPEKQQKIKKTAKGDLIPFRVFETTESFLQQENPPCIIGIEKTNNSVPLSDLNIKKDKTYYFVFGNEEFGVEPSTLTKCNNIYHIPMLGAKNSLNVSVAGGITLHYIASLYY